MSTNNLIKSTHEGKIKLGETELNVAVLSDGARIINYSAIFKAFGRTKRGAQGDSSRVHNMPAFLNANNLQPFVSEDLMSVLEKVDYTNINGTKDSGYDANILPLLCKVYLDARANDKLKTQQLPLARASEILLVSLSKIGITALIDEATGYQYDREKDELQKILQQYISEELLPWKKRFPDEFYREIFKLNGWDFTVKGIKKRPGVIGKWTKKYIYQALPKGVLNALIDSTPKTKEGKLSKRLHQSLTKEQGIEHLNKQIISVVTLMSVSDSWNHFKQLWNKKFGQQTIDFGDYDVFREPKVQPKLSYFNQSLKKGLEHNPNEGK